MKKIVFCDVDGTLLNSRLQITALTQTAIRRLQESGHEFVICSGRSPSAIEPILEEYRLTCPTIAYGGAMISDRDGTVLFHKGIQKQSAEQIVRFLDTNIPDACWCVYSYGEWFVKNRTHESIVREERIVKVEARQGGVASVTASEVSKILCICDPARIAETEQRLQVAFPEFSVFKSNDRMVEIMAKGITKSSAIRMFCKLRGVTIGDAVAFGDGYNDVDMLETVGLGFLMGNAPAALKERFARQTADNDHDGIYYGLKSVGLV